MLMIITAIFRQKNGLFNFVTVFIAFSLIMILLQACSSSTNNSPSLPPAAIANLTFERTKIFRFTWSDVSEATHYKLLENADGNSGFLQIGSDIPSDIQTYDHIVSLYNRVNAQYLLQSCNAQGCSDDNVIIINNTLANSIGYFKASNTGNEDRFGGSISLSTDGMTLAVAANSEDSNSVLINGNQSDNSAADAGAVYIFKRNGITWSQHAYIKASNSEAGDLFGTSVSLNANGTTLAVGAFREDSNDTGINGDQSDNSSIDSGAAYVYELSNNIWSQQAYLKASNSEAGDRMGFSVKLNADGNTLAVAAFDESSNATGVNGIQNDNSASRSGAVYVFVRNSTVWTQEAYIKASNTNMNDFFGVDIGLSFDGNTLAVGALGEASSVTGINGDQSINTEPSAGAVYIFIRSGVSWSQEAYIKASNTSGGDSFGRNISLSGDSSTLAVGAYLEDGNATVINGDQSDNTARNSGAVYIFKRSGSAWSQQAYIKASNAESGDVFGTGISLSNNGDVLVVGAPGESSDSIGVNGDQNNNMAAFSGAAYLFKRNNNSWNQEAYIKASTIDVSDNFARVVSLSGDGETLAVSSYFEDSNAIGINGNQNDNSTNEAGAVFLY